MVQQLLMRVRSMGVGWKGEQGAIVLTEPNFPCGEMDSGNGGHTRQIYSISLRVRVKMAEW